MRYCSEDAPRTAERNVNLNQNTSENAALNKMFHPDERAPSFIFKQGLLAKANGRRPVGRPRTKWTNYIEDLGWNRLGLYPDEMMDVMQYRKVWPLISSCRPRNPYGKAGNVERRRPLITPTNANSIPKLSKLFNPVYFSRLVNLILLNPI